MIGVDLHKSWTASSNEQLTQSCGPTPEISGNSAAAAAISLTDTALIQGVGGKQHTVASDWLRWRTVNKES